MIFQVPGDLSVPLVFVYFEEKDDQGALSRKSLFYGADSTGDVRNIGNTDI